MYIYNMMYLYYDISISLLISYIIDEMRVSFDGDLTQVTLDLRP